MYFEFLQLHHFERTYTLIAYTRPSLRNQVREAPYEHEKCHLRNNTMTLEKQPELEERVSSNG